MTSSTTTSRRACVLALLVGALCVSVGVCNTTRTIPNTSNNPGAYDQFELRTVEPAASDPNTATIPDKKDELKAATIGAKFLVSSVKGVMYFTSTKNATILLNHARGDIQVIFKHFATVRDNPLINLIPPVQSLFIQLERAFSPLSMLLKHWDDVIPDQLKAQNVPDTANHGRLKKLLTPQFVQAAWSYTIQQWSEWIATYMPPVMKTVFDPVLTRMEYVNTHMNAKLVFEHLRRLISPKGSFKDFLHILQNVVLTLSRMPRPESEVSHTNSSGADSGDQTKTLPQQRNLPASGDENAEAHKNIEEIEDTHMESNPSSSNTSINTLLVIVCVATGGAILCLLLMFFFRKKLFGSRAQDSVMYRRRGDVELEAIEPVGRLEGAAMNSACPAAQSSSVAGGDNWATFY